MKEKKEQPQRMEVELRVNAHGDEKEIIFHIPGEFGTTRMRATEQDIYATIAQLHSVRELLAKLNAPKHQ